MALGVQLVRTLHSPCASTYFFPHANPPRFRRLLVEPEPELEVVREQVLVLVRALEVVREVLVLVLVLGPHQHQRF